MHLCFLYIVVLGYLCVCAELCKPLNTMCTLLSLLACPSVWGCHYTIALTGESSVVALLMNSFNLIT